MIIIWTKLEFFAFLKVISRSSNLHYLYGSSLTFPNTSTIPDESAFHSVSSSYSSSIISCAQTEDCQFGKYSFLIPYKQLDRSRSKVTTAGSIPRQCHQQKHMSPQKANLLLKINPANTFHLFRKNLQL